MKVNKPTQPADVEEFIKKAPLSAKENLPQGDDKIEAGADKDPMVPLNVPIPLSIRTWLKIEAAKRGVGMPVIVRMFLEKCKEDKIII